MARVGADSARRLAALDALRAETGAAEAALQVREWERRALHAGVELLSEQTDTLRAVTFLPRGLCAAQAREEYERRSRRVHKVVLATLALLQVRAGRAGLEGNGSFHYLPAPSMHSARRRAARGRRRSQR